MQTFFHFYRMNGNSSAMPGYTVSALCASTHADTVYPDMSGAPSHEIKGEPQSGNGCTADAFMNARAELAWLNYYLNTRGLYLNLAKSHKMCYYFLYAVHQKSARIEGALWDFLTTY